MLGFDGSVVFCAAVDPEWIPAGSQREVLKAQGNDPVWNDANCRNRRIFEDRTGLSAARNTREFLVQTYARENGRGTGGLHARYVDAHSHQRPPLGRAEASRRTSPCLAGNVTM